MSQRSGVCGICQVYHSNLPRHFQECHALKNYVPECRYCFHHEVRGNTMKLHLKKQHPDEDWPLDLLLLQRSCPSFRYLGHCPKCPFKGSPPDGTFGARIQNRVAATIRTKTYSIVEPNGRVGRS